MRFISVCTVGLLAISGSAQQVLPKKPAVYIGADRTSRVEVRPPGLRFGLRKPREVALAPLSESEAASLSGPGPRLKVGIQRHLAPHALAAGAWETAPGGGQFWRMSIRSAGSRGMRVELVNFDAGDGLVWLHDGENVAGPYTGKGPHGDGHFWTETVASELATLEY